MNTFQAQGFASDKLVFGEEEDLFNTLTHFNNGQKDILSGDNFFQDSSNLRMNFYNKQNDESFGLKQTTYLERICNDSDLQENESCQADFGMSANSFHFHFDRFAQEMSGQQEIPKKIGRTSNGILYQVDENDDNEKLNQFAEESTFAKRTTSYTNFEEKHISNNIPEQSISASDVSKVTQIEPLTKPDEAMTQSSKDCSSKTSSKPSKSAKDDVDLSVRRDVVNKTVLRVMRRFFMQKFKAAYPKKFRGKEAKSKWYFEYIKKLVVELFGEDHPDLKVLQTNMAAIINPKHMTPADIAETGLDKEEFLTFYNTIYKYSHTRLASLFQIRALKTIFNHFYNGPMDQIIKSETSVNKNSTLYLQAFEDFHKVFESYTGDSSTVLEMLCLNMPNSTSTLV